MTVAAILFGAALTIAACWSAGALLLRRLQLPLHREEQPIFAFLLGSSAVSLIVFFLGIARLFYPAVLLALAAALILAAVRLRIPRWSPLPSLPQPWGYAFLAVFLFFGANYFLNALRPEISPDGSVYHLGLVARYLREHRIPAITDNLYDSLPKGLEMLFVVAYAFGRHSAAALVHFAFLIATSLAVLNFGRRIGQPVAGMAASLCFFLSPLVALDGTTAYNDVALAGTLFGVFYLLEIWRTDRRPALLAASGFLAGFAFAIKYTGIVGALFAVLYVVWHTRRQAWVALALFAAAALVPALPYPAKNWIVTGNPVAPFLNRWFPNPHMHVSAEVAARERMRNYPGLASRREIPAELALRGAVLEGHIGPLFLLAPVAVLALRSPLGRRTLAAAIVFALPFAGNVGARFLLPALLPLGFAMMLPFSRAPWFLAGVVLAHAITSWPSVARLYTVSGITQLDSFPVRDGLRLEPEEQSLLRREPLYAAAQMVERQTPADAVVLLIGSLPEAYTSRRIVTYHLSARGERLAETLFAPLVPQSPPVKRYTSSFRRQSARNLRVAVTAARAAEQCEFAEVRLFDGDRELPRDAGWRITASPYPWDAPLAFDANPITFWKTWQHARPGDFLAIDLGREEMLDRVEIDAPLRNPGLELRIEGLAEPAAASAALVPPPSHLRRYAIEALRRDGITHIAVAGFVYGAQDLYARPGIWGVEFVAEAAGVKLYRLAAEAE